jgi:hypothetical protein
MKKLFLASLFFFFITYVFGQDTATVIKIHELSEKIGFTNTMTLDSLHKILNHQKSKKKTRIMCDNLYKALEFYCNKDYETALHFVSRVSYRTRIRDYRDLRYVIFFGCYVHLKNSNRYTKMYTIMNDRKFLHPNNMQLVQNIIRENHTNVYSQDTTSVIKLREFIEKIGFTNRISVDSMMKIVYQKKPARGTINMFETLCKSAEAYCNNDYRKALNYAARVSYRTNLNDCRDLKWIILFSCCIHIKDRKHYPKMYAVMNDRKFLLPDNLQLVRNIIRENFTKADFDKALSRYYYYHDRMRVLDELKFNE